MPAAMAQGDADPNEIVASLCSKFSSLIDRVQAAEARQADAHQRTEHVGSTLQKLMETRRAEAAELNAVVVAERGELDRVRRQLHDAHAAASFMAEELRRARETTTSLESQCEQLNRQCHSEHQCVLEASNAAAQSDETWAACERERTNARNEVGQLASQLAELEEQLATEREREGHRRADVRAMEDRVSDACRVRQSSQRRVGARHEEICGAVRKLALYRERLDMARHVLARRQEDFQAEEDEISGLMGENQRQQQEALVLEQQLAQLQDAKSNLEIALREHVEVHDLLKVATTVTTAHKEATETLDRRHRGAEDDFTSHVSRLATIEADVGRWRQRLNAVRDTIEETKVNRGALEKESLGVGNMGATLQSELQHVFSENERMRGDEDELVESDDRLLRQLRTSEPALEAASRRVRELELAFEDADAEALRARQRKDGLMREVSSYREKMTSLRRRHAKLSETAAALEKRVMRSSGALCGTAGFAAQAGRVGTPGGSGAAGGPQATRGGRTAATGSAGAPIGGAPSRTPRSSGTVACVRASSRQADSRGGGGVAAEAMALPPQPASASPSSCQESSGFKYDPSAASLGYLRQYIDLEEQRLGVARTPPRPSPAPSVATRSLPNGVGVVLGTPAIARGATHTGPQTTVPSVPAGQAPSRSAAALAALSAGADPLEVVAMLDGGDKRRATG
eukprot:TRINITY_DN54790_c0_g1_i1.p1 TRINITY_DN54790_c0_g1~~TRINITY_DN54790_c0_g1_i1.p1  ORF type:complete len:690 (+),score=143.44 TRINITY_DN54790_c0_g1_i1:113-2182(+)